MSDDHTPAPRDRIAFGIFVTLFVGYCAACAVVLAPAIWVKKRFP